MASPARPSPAAGHDYQRTLPEHHSDYEEDGEEEGEDRPTIAMSTLSSPVLSAHDDELVPGVSMLEPVEDNDGEPVEGQDQVAYAFFSRPFFSPILMDNSVSEARDFDMNERNYLSMLRLGMYMALGGVLLVGNFRLDDLNGRTSDDERQVVARASIPLGVLLCVLAVVGIGTSFYNYVHSAMGFANHRLSVNLSRMSVGVVVATAVLIVVVNIIFLCVT